MYHVAPDCIRPLNGKVLLKILEQKQEGLVDVQWRTKPDLAKAEVVSVSNGRISKKGRLIPHQLKPGDTVLLSRHFGSILDDEYRLVTEYQVWAIEND